MQVLRRAMTMLGLGGVPEDGRKSDYQVLMRAALSRIRMAELQLREATSLEELDIARSSILSGQAEIQQLVRTAKRERGISVRPISETEETYKTMLRNMGYQLDEHRTRRKTGTAGR
jgi:hypothetical protein